MFKIGVSKHAHSGRGVGVRTWAAARRALAACKHQSVPSRGGTLTSRTGGILPINNTDGRKTRRWQRAAEAEGVGASFALPPGSPGTGGGGGDQGEVHARHIIRVQRVRRPVKDTSRLRRARREGELSGRAGQRVRFHFPKSRLSQPR